MGNDAFKLVGQIGVDTTPLDQGLKQSTAKLQGYGSQVSALGLAIGGAFSVTAIAGLAAYGLQLGKIGAEHQRLDASFRGLAKGPDALIESLKRASGATVSNAQLMLDSNKAVMLGLGSDVDKMGQLMEVARFKGRAMGETTAQAYSDMITGVGRMSPEILDNLGIIVDANATYGAYAASIGKSVNALTAMEKKTALLNRVLQEGNAQIKAAGGLVADAGDAFERYGAKVDNLKADLGGLLVTPATIGVDFVATGVDKVQAVIDGFRAQSPLDIQVRTIAQATADVARATPRVGSGAEEWMGRHTDLASALGPAGVGMYGQPWKTMDDWGQMEAQDRNNRDAQVLRDKLAMLEEYNNRAGAAYAKEQNDLAVIADTQARWAAVTKDFQQGENAALEAQARGYDITTNAMERQDAIMHNANAAYYAQKIATERNTYALGEYNRLASMFETYQMRGALATDAMTASLQLQAEAQANILDLQRTNMPFQKYLDALIGPNPSQLLKTEGDVRRDKLAADKAANTEYWRDYSAKAKEAQSAVKGYIGGAFQGSPSYRGGLVGTAFQLGNAWDERARRVEDVGALGGKSPWAAQFGGWQGLNDQQRQAWAAMQADQIRQHPSIGNLGAEGLAALVAGAKENLAADVDKQALFKEAEKSLLSDPAAVANLKALGYDVKDAFTQPADKISNHVDDSANAIVTAIRGINLNGGGDGKRKPGPGGSLTEGMTQAQIDEFKKWDVKVFAGGGVVAGSGPVPIIAHGGEWIFNAEQQRQLLAMLGANQGMTNNFNAPITVKTDNPRGFMAELNNLMPTR